MTSRMPATEAPEFLSPAQLGLWLGVAPSTLCDLRKRGDGPRWVRLGKAVRYRRSDIEAFLSAASEGGTGGC